MHILTHQYSNSETLQSFINENSLAKNKNIFIQIFTGILEKAVVQEALDAIHTTLPQADIIGASTGGEIINGKMTERKMILVFSVFKNTTFKTYHTDKVDFDSGREFAGKIIEKNTQAIICLNEAIKTDPQNFFKGFTSINSDIIVSGGNAGDNDQFASTFVIEGDKIHDSGMVIATLNSDVLHVHNNYTLHWAPLGREMTITKCTGNTVFEINNKPIFDIYKYYFGNEIETNFPASIMLFPLLRIVDGEPVARTILQQNNDGSCKYAGEFIEGEKVRFAIGNIDAIVDSSVGFTHDVSQHPAEGIYIYSCSGRKALLGENLRQEFELLNSLAPANGFFTLGEFFHTCKTNQVFNLTTTILALSESSQKNKFDTELKKTIQPSTIQLLTNLVNITEKELEETILLQNETQKQLIQSEKMAALGELVAGVAHEINTPVGNAYTGITHLHDETVNLGKLYEKSKMSEEDFKNYLQNTTDLTSSIESNLRRAAELVKSFKQVAVDQSSDGMRTFNLLEYIEEILLSLRNRLKHAKHTINIDVSKEINIKSYPGVFSQILTNFIINSLIHGFEPDSTGSINISANIEKGLLIFKYKDNGRGMTELVKKRVFDPFFTTNRKGGSTGLGMNIVFNLVTQKLGGNIICNSEPGLGVEFIITVPV